MVNPIYVIQVILIYTTGNYSTLFLMSKENHTMVKIYTSLTYTTMFLFSSSVQVDYQDLIPEKSNMRVSLNVVTYNIFL